MKDEPSVRLAIEKLASVRRGADLPGLVVAVPASREPRAPAISRFGIEPRHRELLDLRVLERKERRVERDFRVCRGSAVMAWLTRRIAARESRAHGCEM